MEVQVDPSIDPDSEINELLEDESTSPLLRAVLRLLHREDAKVARDLADRVDELCERRLTATLTSYASAQGSRDPKLDAELLNADCDNTTGRLMKFIGKQIFQMHGRGTSQLVLVATTRALICTSVTLSGVELGLARVRSVFEETLEELAPLLRDMPESGVPYDE